MRFYIKNIFLFTVVLLLIECKPSVYFKTADTALQLDSTTTTNKHITDFIQPYKTALDAEMNEILVISSEEFKKERGKPETKLGNLVADLSFEIGTQLYQPTDGHLIDFCLLNFGGLRTSLPKGEISRGKIFELMPFENELVVVTITQDSMTQLIDYLKKVGGQPIGGGLSITFGKPITAINEDFGGNNIKIVTSDYLANGGDNMNFFLNPVKIEPLNIKLRDAIIQYCISENKKGNQLFAKLDGRITFDPLASLKGQKK